MTQLSTGTLRLSTGADTLLIGHRAVGEGRQADLVERHVREVETLRTATLGLAVDALHVLVRLGGNPPFGLLQEIGALSENKRDALHPPQLRKPAAVLSYACTVSIRSPGLYPEFKVLMGR